MPLAAPSTITKMDDALRNITNNLPSTPEAADSWQAAEAWGPVATAYFSEAVIPSVTEIGKTVGEQAFVAACKASMGAETNKVNEASLAAGFAAYAMAVCAPGACNPPAPVVHAPPMGQPAISFQTVPPSDSTLPATTTLHTQLMAWVVSGTQTTPGAPPVVLPWS